MRATTHPGLDGEPIHRDYDATASRHLTRMLLNTMVGLRLPARAGDGPDRLHRVIDATIDSLGQPQHDQDLPTHHPAKETTMTREMRLPGPEHPIEISDNPSPLRVLTRDGNSLIAETTSAVTLCEAGYPPVHYLPLADVDPAALKRSDSHTYCPYKGEASYYHLIVDGQQKADAVWCYDDPYDAVKAIAGRVAFYPQHVQIITSAAADD